jgi:phosphoadenosine phosphosulfate reductase
MTTEKIIQELRKHDEAGKKMFLTSSFQTHSIPLLHIISRSQLSIPIYCLNTGFLFPETLLFKDELANRYNLDIREITSSTPKHQQRDKQGNFFFASNPDYCCHLNKVEPTSRLLDKYDIWINGVRADQNANRRSMKTYQDAGKGAMRFHPILDWSSKDIYAYIKEFDLPRHPLDSQGYNSIGCEPCTRKSLNDDPRAARWFGLNKTECGLHTELVEKK